MKNVLFTAEAGRPDDNGNVLNIAGLCIPEAGVMLTQNFDAEAVIARCVPFVADGALKVRADLPNEALAAYPAVGFSVLESQPNEFGGRTITKAKLHEVSLCSTRNADPLIMSVAEQAAEGVVS